MPLTKSTSKAAFSHNVAVERKAGKPVKQSVAIAYSEKESAKKRKKMWKGGSMDEDCDPLEEALEGEATEQSRSEVHEANSSTEPGGHTPAQEAANQPEASDTYDDIEDIIGKAMSKFKKRKR